MATIKSVYLAMPVKDSRMEWVTHEAQCRAMAALRGRGISTTRAKPKAGLVDITRDRMLATFLLQTSCDAIWWCDDDLSFPPDAILRLVDALDRGFELVGGVYSKREVNWKRIKDAAKKGAENLEDYASEPVVRWLPENWDGSKPYAITNDGFIEVEGLGFGFIVQTRASVERMWNHYRDELEYNSAVDGDAVHVALFEPKRLHGAPREERRARFSEDFTFCQRFRAIGGTVYADGRTRFDHFGPHPFTCAPLLELLGELEEVDEAPPDSPEALPTIELRQ